MRLAAENARRKTAVGVDRRALPEQQPFDRELRVPRILVRARGVGELVSRDVEGIDDWWREMAAGIRKVVNRLAEICFEILF